MERTNEEKIASLVYSREDAREIIRENYNKIESLPADADAERVRLIAKNNEINEALWNIAEAIAQLEEGVVYVRWDMNADSWSGSKSFLSVHKTLEGAIAAIPERIRTDTYKRDLYGNYVANYTYEAVERVELGD